jgi:hypothetical protein
MARKNRNRKSRKQRARTQGMPNPSASAITYRGPIFPAKYREGDDRYTIVCTDEIAVASNGSGVVALTLTNDPANVTGTSSGATVENWSSLSAVFSEYRVLAIQVDYTPLSMFSFVLNASPGSSDNSNGVVITGIDRTSNAGSNPASYAAVAAFASAREWCINQKIKVLARMDGTREAAFNNIGSTPLGLFAIKMYGSSFQAGVTYGRMLVRYLLQFRSA